MTIEQCEAQLVRIGLEILEQRRLCRQAERELRSAAAPTRLTSLEVGSAALLCGDVVGELIGRDFGG